MIVISNENGSPLKVFSSLQKNDVIGYHPRFGFVTESSYKHRAQNRVRHGFKKASEDLSFSFALSSLDAQGFLELTTPKGKFTVRNLNESELEKATAFTTEQAKEEKDSLFSILLLIVLMLPLIYLAIPKQAAEEQPQVLPPVVVKLAPEIQKKVSIPAALAQVPKNLQNNAQVRRAVQQDLGFIGILGKKNLTKALGGAPTQLKDASPGAGAGGKEGSGGELLVGLGQGLKRTTVGNTGVAGLGGVGTKGAGGGQGGYGTTSIGSGEGRGLSSIPLSQDVVLEGGLDRSVVQATIAKYLSQVRACYEQGLKNNPGLGGLVTMAFEINGSGNLNFAHTEKSTLGDPGVEQCIGQRMMTWKFPNPRGGVNVKVSYPFLLRSARS